MTGVRCTDRVKKRNKRRKSRNRWVASLSVILVILCAVAVFVYLTDKKGGNDTMAAEYEAKTYNKTLYRAEKLFAEDLCVASENVALEGVEDVGAIHAAALFDVNGKTVDYAYNIHERLYPASTTKILTALTAIKHGNLDDTVTVSENADAGTFSSDEQICGIHSGDQLTLRDLLYGLMLYSGNDNAVAIAEHVAGSVEDFVELMNQEAESLMATQTHFVNTNGLHDENHYTTAYDLYLIFNECIRQPEFVEIIGTDSYTAHVTKTDGSTADMVWEPTHYYASGAAALPKGAEVIGGKTGFHDQAGSCLILLDKDEKENPYISIVMGADSKEILYQDMTSIIEAIPEG